MRTFLAYVIEAGGACLALVVLDVVTPWRWVVGYALIRASVAISAYMSANLKEGR